MDRGVTERELQDWIAGTARLLGWRIFHARVARTATGWRTAVSYDGCYPDWTLVRERVVYAEVKGGRGRLRSEQVVWLDVLREAGEEVYVSRETDWTSGAVENVLRSARAEEVA
jgi:hypothetical protein